MGAGRIKLSEKYQTEREEICKKLIEIVGTEFYLYDIENDPEKQAAILAMKDEIQKCFAVGTLSSFKPVLKDVVKRDYLNIVRGIMKRQGYSFEAKATVKTVTDTGLLKRTMLYKIFRE